MSRLMRKHAFYVCENKDADQLCSNCAADPLFICYIVQFLFFQNLKFQAYSHRLWLYSPVRVSPGPKPHRFSCVAAHIVNIKAIEQS